MKERPISFSPMLIDRIQAGVKTMTRRIIRLSDNLWDVPEIFWDPLSCVWVLSDNVKHYPIDIIDCPFGECGDLLWIRQEHKITQIHKPGATCETWVCEFRDGTIIEKYAKSIPLTTVEQLRKRKTQGKWQRARFLPKVFARIWLEITDIKAERLTEISAGDAIREGIEELPPWPEAPDKKRYKLYNWPDSAGEAATFVPIASFYTLWCSIYGDKAVVENPWVWVITFKPIVK